MELEPIEGHIRSHDVGDETVRTFLNEARDPAVTFPGAIVATADVDEPVVAEVVDVVEELAGMIVHLALLAGLFEDYEALVRRCSA